MISLGGGISDVAVAMAVGIFLVHGVGHASARDKKYYRIVGRLETT